MPNVACGNKHNKSLTIYHFRMQSHGTLIAGYVQHGHMEVALSCFEEMWSRGFLPDAVTFACILRACSRVGAINKCQYLHVEISKGCLLEKDIVVGTALLDSYASCGFIDKEQDVFDELPFQNVVLWIVLIASYCHYGHGKMRWHALIGCSLGAFLQMQLHSCESYKLVAA